MSQTIRALGLNPPSAAVRVEGPPPSGCAESSIAPRGAPRSSARPVSACSPTSDSPSPSARPSDGSRGGRCAGRIAERTSISAQSAADASAAACPASRSWRSPGGPPGPSGTHGRPAGGDRRPSGAATESEPGAAGAGFPRSGRRSSPALALEPAGHHAQHHLQRRGVDHGVELISSARLTDVGRVVEHYGVEPLAEGHPQFSDRPGSFNAQRNATARYKGCTQSDTAGGAVSNP